MVLLSTNYISELARARQVQIVSNAVTAAMVILFVFGVKAVAAGAELRIAMSVVAEVLLFLSLLSVRNNKIDLALTLFFVMAWMAIIVANVTIGGFENIAMSWWVILVGLAGLIGGRRYCFCWGVTAIVTIVGLWCVNHWLPGVEALVVEENKVNQLRMHLIAQLMIAVVIVLSFLRVTEQYDQQILSYNKVLEDEVDQRRLAEEEAHASHKSSLQFFANMSHEVRTPLNSILGFSARLLKKAALLDDKDRAALERIHNNGQGLANLVSEMFELWNIALLELNYSAVPFDFNLLVEECFTAVSPSAEKYNLKLELCEQSEVNLSIVADRQRLHQAIVNVIYFAIRQTESGGITVKLSKVHNNGIPSVRLIISDTSAGIAPEHIEEIFETHYHCVFNSNKNLPVSALTLVLSSRLISLHQGTIAVSSELSKGTAFTICIPLMPDLTKKRLL